MKSKDFTALSDVIMDESDSLHSICALTGLQYMNDCTWAITKLIKDLNKAEGWALAAYTVDAGANCFVIC